MKLLTVCANDVWFDFCFLMLSLLRMGNNTIDSESITECISGLGAFVMFVYRWQGPWDPAL